MFVSVSSERPCIIVCFRFRQAWLVYLQQEEDKGRHRKKRNIFVDDIAAVDEEEEEEEEDVRSEHQLLVLHPYFAADCMSK